MNRQDDQIKKIIGKASEKPPLGKLKEINRALRKMGCKNVENDSHTFYRKIVGRR